MSKIVVIWYYENKAASMLKNPKMNVKDDNLLGFLKLIDRS